MSYLSNYEDILVEFLKNYSTEFGERKTAKILEKVMTSNKIARLLSTSLKTGSPITHKLILHCINEIPYFIFSRGQTQALAGLLIIHKWNLEVNSIVNLSTNIELTNTAKAILEESHITYF